MGRGQSRTCFVWNCQRRSLDVTKSAFDHYDLPEPDVLICSAGSEIYYTGNNWLTAAGKVTLTLQWGAMSCAMCWADSTAFACVRRSSSTKIQTELYVDDRFTEDDLANLHILDEKAQAAYPSTENRYLDILPYRASKRKCCALPELQMAPATQSVHYRAIVEMILICWKERRRPLWWPTTAQSWKSWEKLSRCFAKHLGEGRDGRNQVLFEIGNTRSWCSTNYIMLWWVELFCIFCADLCPARAMHRMELAWRPQVGGRESSLASKMPFGKKFKQAVKPLTWFLKTPAINSNIYIQGRHDLWWTGHARKMLPSKAVCWFLLLIYDLRMRYCGDIIMCCHAKPRQHFGFD